MRAQLVYLAGPITGLTYAETIGWRQEAIDKFPDNIIGLSPMRSKNNLLQETSIQDTYDTDVFTTQRGIYHKDLFDCRRADAILVNVLGTERASIGTVMEIAWGALLNKPVILIMESGNIHDHCMVREASPMIVSDLDSAIALLTELLLPVPH